MLTSGMFKFGTLGGWGGTFFAGLLTFALLIPTLDTYMCIADVQQPQSATAQLDQSAKSVPAQPKQQHDEGDASCIHGHCHHWVGIAKIGERLAFDVTLTDGKVPSGLFGPLPSAPQNQLLRPPQV